jgi:hypothetical protein
VSGPQLRAGARHVRGEPRAVAEGNEAVLAALPDRHGNRDRGQVESPRGCERDVVVEPAPDAAANRGSSTVNVAASRITSSARSCRVISQPPSAGIHDTGSRSRRRASTGRGRGRAVRASPQLRAGMRTSSGELVIRAPPARNRCRAGSGRTRRDRGSRGTGLCRRAAMPQSGRGRTVVRACPAGRPIPQSRID